MAEPTRGQRRTLRVLRDILSQGKHPTRREIADRLNLSSVDRHLSALRQQGFVSWKTNAACTIGITPKGERILKGANDHVEPLRVCHECGTVTFMPVCATCAKTTVTKELV